MDLSFFLQPPERTVRGRLVIEALAPLSMSPSQPGSYYQSLDAPADAMLLGLVENALGWHLSSGERKSALKDLQKRAKKQHRKTSWKGSGWLSDKPTTSGSGYMSLLGHHLVFDGLREVPPVLSYDDLWARQAHRSDDFFGGSRRYDARLENAVTHIRAETVKFATKGKATHTEAKSVLEGVEADETIFQKALKPQFPYYYVSPTPRGYVVPQGPYIFGASATPRVSEMLIQALADPAAPLYLGSNDGWVDARWEVDR